jgi:hypothetical protein
MTVTPRLRSSSLHNDAIGLQATNCRSWNMAGLQMQNIDYSSLYSAVLLQTWLDRTWLASGNVPKLGAEKG